MAANTLPGGTFTMARGPHGHPRGLRRDAADRTPGVFGPPPADRDGAIAVLREAVSLGPHPHRHLRRLRPARHQRDHQGSPRTPTRTICTS